MAQDININELLSSHENLVYFRTLISHENLYLTCIMLPQKHSEKTGRSCEPQKVGLNIPKHRYFKMYRKVKCDSNLQRATSGAESCRWSEAVLRRLAGFPFLIRWSCKTPPGCLKMSESSLASLPAPWMSRRLISPVSLTTKFFSFSGLFDKSLMHASIRALMSPVRTASFTTWPKSDRLWLRSCSEKEM